MNQFPPASDHIQIFLNIRGDIRSLMCNIGVIDTGGKSKNFRKFKKKLHLQHKDKLFSSSSLSGVSSLTVLPLFANSVVDTGGKFAAGINDTSGIGGKLPPVSLIPVANLPPVSLTSVANLPPVHLGLQLSRKFSNKIQNDLNAIIRGLGEDDSRKKTRSKKSRDTVP
jgi:hypothetical protein